MDVMLIVTIKYRKIYGEKIEHVWPSDMSWTLESYYTHYTLSIKLLTRMTFYQK